MSTKTWYCQECGSTDVRHDAVAVWNPKTNAYEVVCVFDDTWCEDCASRPPLCENMGKPVFGELPSSSTHK